MKRLFEKILALLPHAAVILSLMAITFLITDYYNQPMAFVSNPITKALLFVLALLSLGESIVLIRLIRKKKWADYRSVFGEDEDETK